MITKKIHFAELENVFYVNEIKCNFNNNSLTISVDTNHVFGCGERFDSVNHKEKIIHNEVIEKFCNQGDKTYMPIPFFMTDKQFGLFVNTYNTIDFTFGNEIKIDCTKMTKDDVLYFISGNFQEMISDLLTIVGKTPVIDSSFFGPWFSGHCWNSQDLALEQIDKLKKYNLPATTFVFEQWSDEATFYIFNESQYKNVDKFKNYDDFENSTLWPNPKEMIQKFHDEGLKILLWQCPVIKKLESHEVENAQNTYDWNYAIKHDLVIKNGDGTPYTIPQGHWFSGSLIPDFSKEETKEWWFKQRQYLLDIGVDGFKTDGGEFVCSDDVADSNGFSGNQLKNKYSADYTQAYSDFVGKDRIIFSRAGYIGQNLRPAQWAGDQQSTFAELKNVLKAGINASLSGINYWGFDIGGFAGQLPSVDLYKKATQFATFVPIMQVHSEPMGGQFKELLATQLSNNERTPWNIATFHNDKTVMDVCKKYYHLRMNIVPYIASKNYELINKNKTLMRHLIVDYPNDPNVLDIHDEFMFCDLLIAPCYEENTNTRYVYLPKGRWINLFNHEAYEGNQTILVKTLDIPVFVQNGKAILSKKKLFDEVDNSLELSHIHITCFGNSGKDKFINQNEIIEVEWEDNKLITTLDENKVTIEFI